MNRKLLYVLGAALLCGFAFFAFASFKTALTPYVSYEAARSMERTVQVAGGLLADSSSYDEASQALWFSLEDEESGETLRVRYGGVKPANFEDAISIVAIGRWDPAQEALAADKLLVKCPSKYQGIEGAETKTYG